MPQQHRSSAALLQLPLRMSLTIRQTLQCSLDRAARRKCELEMLSLQNLDVANVACPHGAGIKTPAGCTLMLSVLRRCNQWPPSGVPSLFPGSQPPIGHGDVISAMRYTPRSARSHPLPFEQPYCGCASATRRQANRTRVPRQRPSPSRFGASSFDVCTVSQERGNRY